MAVPYVSQFIPTDVGLMNQLLQQRQAQYDQAIAQQLAMEDAYAQLQSAPQDIAGKQVLMQKFQDDINKIVGRYGGDYGAARKDIARAVSKARQNPAFQYLPKAAQLAEEQRRRQQQLGKYGITTQSVPQVLDPNTGEVMISPDQLTYNVVDIGDALKMGQQAGKSFSEGYRYPVDQVTSGGLREVGKQFGAVNRAEAAQLFSQRPELQEAYSNILESYGINPQDHSEQANMVRESILAAMVGNRQTNFIAPEKPTDGGLSRTGSFTSAELQLPKTEFPNQSSYKKSTREIADAQREMDSLEKSLNNALVSGNTTQAAILQNKMDALQQEIEPLVTRNTRLREVYVEPYANKLEELKSNLYNNILGIVGNENIANQLLETINENAITDKYNSVRGTYILSSNYANKFGKDSFEDLKAQIGSDGLQKLHKLVSSDTGFKAIKSIEDNIRSDIKTDALNISKTGESASSYLLPTLDADSKTLKGIDGKTYESATYRLINSLQQAPEAYEFELYEGGKKLSTDSRKFKKFMDDLATTEIIPVSASESDPSGKPFIYAKYNVSGERSPYSLKVMLDKKSDKTKMSSIARDYLLIGDLKSAIKFTDPKISQDIDKALREGNQPNNFSVDVLNTTIDIVRDPITGRYSIVNPITGTPTIPMDKQDLKYNLYNLYIANTIR